MMMASAQKTQYDPLIGYCTNVHPCESLSALKGVLDQDIPRVASALSAEDRRRFGLGLRVGAALLRELIDPDERRQLTAKIEALEAPLFTINGFPYGDFNSGSVKAEVYDPDWRTQTRLEYSLQLADLLAELPGPSRRTISTVAGGFRVKTEGTEARQQIANQLSIAARHLAEIEARGGPKILLCLEPEPHTTLESTEETIDFFQDVLYPLGEHARRHLALCYDCCHQAVHFEIPEKSLQALTDAGVEIGKVQVSSALELRTPGRAEDRAALLAFDEPRYLHQSVARARDGRLLRALDLDMLRAPDEQWRDAEAWRTHFHVPIWWEGAGPLSTTRESWQATVRWLTARGLCDQYEVETYSWDVIPEQHKVALGGLHGAIGRELTALGSLLPSRLGGDL